MVDHVPSMQAILVVVVKCQDNVAHLCHPPLESVAHLCLRHCSASPAAHSRSKTLCKISPCPFTGALPGASADASTVRTRVRVGMANCRGDILRCRLGRRPLRSRRPLSMCAASFKMWLSEARGGDARQLPALVCKSLICTLYPTCKNLQFFAGLACSVVGTSLALFRLGLCCIFVIWYIINVYIG